MGKWLKCCKRQIKGERNLGCQEVETLYQQAEPTNQRKGRTTAKKKEIFRDFWRMIMDRVGEWLMGTLIVVGIIISVALFGTTCLIGAVLLLAVILFLFRPILSIVLIILLIALIR